MFSSSEILKALVAADQEQYDILCVARGGGDNIRGIFNDLGLCKQAIQCQSLIASAIGHAEDKPLFDIIADKYFITPTAFGEFIKNLHKEINQNINYHEQKDKELLGQIYTLKSTNKGLTDSITDLKYQHQSLNEKYLSGKRSFNILLIIISLLVRKG